MSKEKADVLFNSLSEKQPLEMTREEAVRLIIKGNLRKQNYMVLRKIALDHHVYIYPSYDKVILEQKFKFIIH